MHQTSASCQERNRRRIRRCAAPKIVRVPQYLPDRPALIIIKTTVATPPASCGGHMPFQGEMLGDQTLGAIRTWILQGANP
jgi:hypothetical protein